MSQSIKQFQRKGVKIFVQDRFITVKLSKFDNASS